VSLFLFIGCSDQSRRYSLAIQVVTALLRNPETLDFLYTIDQRRILVHKKLKHHTSVLISVVIAKLCHRDILSVADKYGIKIMFRYTSSILCASCNKMSAWNGGRHLLHLLHRFLVCISIYEF